jgi:hypothetical protein
MPSERDHQGPGPDRPRRAEVARLDARWDLATQTDRRLRLAGIELDDPGLVRIRAWNRRLGVGGGAAAPADSMGVTAGE